MPKAVAIMSMSLEGYVADLNDGVTEVFDWHFASGAVEFHAEGSDPRTFRASRPSGEHLRGLWCELGTVLNGRRTFDKAQRLGGNHAWGPAFVLTHQIPRRLASTGLPGSWCSVIASMVFPRWPCSRMSRQRPAHGFYQHREFWKPSGRA
jgi:hypothetical protein